MALCRHLHANSKPLTLFESCHCYISLLDGLLTYTQLTCALLPDLICTCSPLLTRTCLTLLPACSYLPICLITCGPISVCTYLSPYLHGHLLMTQICLYLPTCLITCCRLELVLTILPACSCWFFADICCWTGTCLPMIPVAPARYSARLPAAHPEP